MKKKFRTNDFSKKKMPRILRTCSEWYQIDQTCDIVDPDGFHRSSKVASTFWFFVPVEKSYYESRKRRCTTMSFNKMGHLQPFMKSQFDEDEMDTFLKSEIGNLIWCQLISQ